MHPKTSLADHESLESAVHRRFVHIYLSQTPKAQLGLFLATLFTAYVWHSGHGGVYPLIWLALMLGVTASRALFTRRFVESALTHRAQTQRIGITLIVSGLVMATPLLGFGAMTYLERAALTLILITTATASVITTSGHRNIFLWYAAPMSIPLSISWGTQSVEMPGENQGYLFAFLVLFYQFFLMGLARDVRNTFVELCNAQQKAERQRVNLEIALSAVENANQAKSRFFASASHDLRQPIHSMNLLVAALNLRKLDPGTQEITQLLTQVGQTLTQELDALLDLSRLDMGNIKPDLKQYAVNDLLLAHKNAMQPMANEKKIELRTVLNGSPFAITDHALFLRILGNLTHNAIKFTPPGGVVTLHLETTDHKILVSIIDNGIGFSAEHKHRVFEEFYQIRNLERDRTQGLGLGLSIVDRLCRLLDISIEMHSEPNKGTRVVLGLKAELNKPASVEKEAPPAHTKALRVLVVDDEPLVRQSMSLLLAQLGCQAESVDGSAAALETCSQAVFDVAIVDHRLKDGDSGIDLILRIIARRPETRAVLMTGDTHADITLNAEKYGIPIFHKPILERDLYQLLGIEQELQQGQT